MNTLEVRERLVEKFLSILEDEGRLHTLEGALDAINVDEKSHSEVPDSYYQQVVLKRRERILSGTDQAIPWEEVKGRLIIGRI